MRTPEELRRRLQSRWQNQRRNWLLGQGEWPLSLSTEPPTEAKVLAEWARFDEWLAQWRVIAQRHADAVRYEARAWSRVGEQNLPCAWRFASPEAVALELGCSTAWSRAKQRFAVLAAWKDDAAWQVELSRHFDLLANLDEDEFQRLCTVVDWLWRHPASGLYPRQLPIAGIDTKWLDSYRGVTTAWVGVLHASEAREFYAATGLRAAPDRLRMRLLDRELCVVIGGLSDIEAPAEEFIGLMLPARQVLIVENLVTGLACETLPGTVVFMRRGYAVEVLAKLPWLAQLPVYYWGDIDTHGLAILSRLRGYLPRTQSLMMDEATLLTFKALWGREEKPAAPELAHLTEAEQQLYRALREGEYKQVRLEQERIAWNVAWPHVTSAMSP
ncbi:Wadjet anti-phage system protein JetD domain-containing protein [Dyella sp.]|uniref:Wadjet anti-phage system protein JetD domain-containing protein n=1 Tax=Dyella sp. TaxID=1869338 RepID=UPI002D764D00|nr:Wadjet anti-phage system protein JetD domain-containing protein [Dyella sp.]HET7333366.1 Wadjet anti-phage system protein JetD domain-containing protein [Dyella sp.]